MRPYDGADAIALAMASAGVRHVFGVPGTQNASLFAALGRTPIRTVITGSELAAAFMANGYRRAGGSVPVVATIPGPGFTFALTGLAEAAHDSVAMVLVTGMSAQGGARRFDLQAIDQEGMVRGLARRVLRLERIGDAPRVVGEALHAATADGPGPVVVEVAPGLLTRPAVPAGASFEALPAPVPDPAAVSEIADRLRAARRVVVFAGQGTVDAAGALATLVDRRPALVVTTVSARGVLPESHPWSLAYDFLACSVAETNRLLEEADFVLVLGCRTSHNGTGGFGIRLPEDRTAQVDLDPEVLGANYSPRWTVRARTETFLEAVIARLGVTQAPSQWTPADAATWRQRLREKSQPNPPEPRFPGTASGTAEEFFRALGQWLPPDAIVVTDTGQHQIMARCHLRVESPRGLIVPSDYQSMGFGLPAAIGAALAASNRQVVAVLGDGGMRMVGLELATAVREGIDIVAIVFNDGYLGQIRMQQLSSASGEAAMALATVDLEALAAATGADYARIETEVRGALASLPKRGVTLVEVPLVDSAEIRSTRRRARLTHSAKRLAGPAGRSVLRRLLRRG